MKRFLVLAAAACSSTPTPDPTCETKVPLVDHTVWTIVPEEADPFPPPATGGSSRGRCGPADMGIEDLNSELSYTINTRFCSYGTAEQPALVGVQAGEALTLRVWYFSQARFEAAEAEVLVAFGDDPIWTRTVSLPATTGGLLLGTLASPASMAAGTPVRWHLSNHGENTWNIIELSVTRRVPCSEVAGGRGSHDK